jgi:8-oxo-dGTP pyrophosphatase MutT (NUDIX family)
MKKLSVVFVIYKNVDGENFILLGKQAPGKKLEGFRNGYGGKCEEGETTLECSKREMKEELGEEFVFGMEAKISSELKYFGKLFMDDKQVDFFVAVAPEKFLPPADNSEFVDTKWFSLSKPEEFLGEMLSGDDKIISALNHFLKTGENFEIKKTGDKLLENQVRNIYR